MENYIKYLTDRSICLCKFSNREDINTIETFLSSKLLINMPNSSLENNTKENNSPKVSFFIPPLPFQNRQESKWSNPFLKLISKDTRNKKILELAPLNSLN